MAMPVTRYTKSGDVHIAYQVFGSGPIDLIFVPGFAFVQTCRRGARDCASLAGARG